MIRTVNPYNTARTAEIMSRYRPIAPKPEAPANSGVGENLGVPQSMRRSPYLRNVWNHLQARPTRTRKRGRTAFAPPTMKGARNCLQGLSAPYQTTNSPAKNLAILGFAQNPTQVPLLPNLVPLKCGLDTTVTTLADSVALPVLRCAKPFQPPSPKKPEIDLNMAVEEPEEVDLNTPQSVKPGVITPRAVRPIGSTITVKNVNENLGLVRPNPAGKMSPFQVEEEVDAEEVPAVVSDSNNRVRLTNSAYKEMVGQPQCCWLDFMHSGEGKVTGGGACKRIGGEVLLQLEETKFPLWTLNGFNCWVKIEWENNGKRSCVNAFCEALKVECDGKDYQLLWKFHINHEASKSKSNI